MSDANPLDKLLNGNDDKTPYAIKAPTQRLRPVAEIAQLLNAFNVEVERKKAFSTSNIDTLVTTLSGPEYSSGIKSLAPKIIRRLADAAGSDAASVREYDALGMKYPKIKSDAAAYS